MSASREKIMSRPCNKRSKSLSPNDRISKLPDDIISHILSRLLTVDATQTSLLSRCWRYKWTSIYDINIDDIRFRGLSESDFINFVFRILISCNSRIRSFSLSLPAVEYDKYEHGHCNPDPVYAKKYVETWITWVLMRNVEILKICARTTTLERLDSSCFHNWTSLTELELYLKCTLVLPVDNRLPNLKRLLLDGDCDRRHGGIKIKQEQISTDGRIILIFPVLEYLFLKCEWLDVNFVEIHAPELITFETVCLNELKSYEIKIVGAKLTTFSSSNGFINNFHLHGSPAVSYAELDHSFDTTCFRAHKILKHLPNLECLTLSGDFAKLLPSKCGLVFPTFDRLRELHLDFSNIEDIMELLQLLPEVEFLNIDVTDWGNDQESGMSWDPKIVSNLKKVKLEEFRGHNPQLDFLQFILENAKKLKKMSVVIYDGAPANLRATIKFMSKVLGKTSSCVIRVL